MRLAKGWPELERANRQRVADLSFREALALLREPAGEEAQEGADPRPSTPEGVPVWLIPLVDRAAGWSVAETVRELRGFLGDVDSELRFESYAPPTTWGRDDTEALLRIIRPEDMPMVYLARLPRQGECPDHVIQACRLFWEHLVAQRGTVKVWEMAATWWCCQAALCERIGEGLVRHLEWWKERALNSVAYWITHAPEEGEDDKADFFGHRSDLRHLGILKAATRQRDEGGAGPLGDLLWRALGEAAQRDAWLLSSSQQWASLSDPALA
jgi:hypothetical protein